MPSESPILVEDQDGVREFDQHILTAQRRDATLKVPPTISHEGSLGRSVAFAQLVATWATTCAERHVDVKLDTSDPRGLERFVSRLHGLAAAYYAARITASGAETNLRRELLEAAKPRIKAMSERKFALAARGLMAEFVFVHRAHRQFHSAAYRQEPSFADLMDPQRHGNLIVPPREMNALIRNVLTALRLSPSHFRRISPLLDNPDIPLGHLLHEVFRNTAEHAYLVNRRIPAKGIRCILIAVRANPSDALRSDALVSASHPHVIDYFRGLQDRAGRKRRSLVHVLELSVFDTGPGFAATMDPVVPPDRADVDRVAQCFRDHVSSKPGPNSGLGLGRLLSHVKSLGGYVRIRTSTTEAFFSSHDERHGGQLLPHVAGSLPKTIGTALTVAIPLAL